MAGAGACGGGKGSSSGTGGGGSGGIGAGAGETRGTGGSSANLVQLPSTLVTTPCRWLGVGSVQQILYSPDNSLIGVTDSGRFLKIYRAGSWDEVLALPPYGVEPVFAFAGSGAVAVGEALGSFGDSNPSGPDAGAAVESGVRFYSLTDGSLQGSIVLGGESAVQLAGAPDGSFVVGLVRDGTAGTYRVACWDVATRAERWSQVVKLEPATFQMGMAISPDSQQIALSASSGLTVVSPTDGSTIWTDTSGAAPLVYSRDGKLIGGGGGEHATIWDAVAHAPSQTPSVVQWIESLVFSPADDIVYLGYEWNGSSDGMPAPIQAMQLANILASGPKFTPHKLGVSALVLSPDGTQLVSGGADPAINVSNASTGALLSQIPGNANIVGAVSASASAGLLLSAADNPDLLVWNAASGAVTAQLPVGANTAGLSADGSTLYYEDTLERTLTFADVASGATLGTIPDDPVATFAISPDGSRFAMGHSSGAVDVHLVADQSLVWTVNASAGPIAGLDFSGDGSALAGISNKGKEIDVWGTQEGKVVTTASFAPTAYSALSAIRFSPDGSYVAAVGAVVDPSILSASAALLMVHLPDGTVSGPRYAAWSTGFTDLAISPDSLLIATQGPTAVWRAADLTPVYAVNDDLHHLAFVSPTELSTGEANGSVSIWCAPASSGP
jgi:WD40 repeat protein